MTTIQMNKVSCLKEAALFPEQVNKVYHENGNIFMKINGNNINVGKVEGQNRFLLNEGKIKSWRIVGDIENFSNLVLQLNIVIE